MAKTNRAALTKEQAYSGGNGQMDRSLPLPSANSNTDSSKFTVQIWNKPLPSVSPEADIALQAKWDEMAALIAGNLEHGIDVDETDEAVVAILESNFPECRDVKPLSHEQLQSILGEEEEAPESEEISELHEELHTDAPEGVGAARD